VAVAWSFTTSDYRQLYRYSFPFLFPCVIIACSLALQRWRFGKLAMAAGAMAVALLATNIVPGGMDRATEAEMFYRNQTTGVFLTTDSTYRAYEAAQKAIPRGARVLSFLPQPTLLDYERNDIVTVDYPSVACPAPGMPLAEGAEAFRQYLKAQGVEYIIAADFDKAPGVYGRAYYLQMRDHPESFEEISRTEMVIMQYHLAALDLVDALARSPRLVNPGQGIRVIQVSP
jgi:hypothetical protein